MHQISKSAAANRRRRAREPGYSTRKNADWKGKNREKYLAHKRVENAVKSGALVRGPCEIVGCTEKAQAHHDDYTKPLDVRWLCQRHHQALHARLPEISRG